jgi:hypothetical protein
LEEIFVGLDVLDGVECALDKLLGVCWSEVGEFNVF